jgi:DNA-binding transcriptional MerR regulator
MSKSPDAFRTISEVAEWLDTPTYVLRFWESRFPQIKPVKRAGGRRYYRPDDMLLLGGIKKLLHFNDRAIKDVKEILKEDGVKHVMSLSPNLDTQVVSPPSKSDAKDKAHIDALVKAKPKGKKKPAVEVRVVKKGKVAQDTAAKEDEPKADAKAAPSKEAAVSKDAKSKDAAKKDATQKDAAQKEAASTDVVGAESAENLDAIAKAKAEEAARIKAAKKAAAKKQAADEEASKWAGLVPDEVKKAPYRVQAYSAYDADRMEEIETLYYSLRMARNSMRRAKEQQEKRAS